MLTLLPMRRLLLYLLVIVCLSPIAYLLPACEARDFVRGPLIISLSDNWNVSEEPGPELLKATLVSVPTATLSVWKYKPGPMSPEQFLDGLRSDLGWTSIVGQTLMDSRFGRTNIGLYRKAGAYEEVPFKIRSCDFVLDGDIYVLEMRAPSAQFDAADTAFRSMFNGLSNMSGAVARDVAAKVDEKMGLRLDVGSPSPLDKPIAKVGTEQPGRADPMITKRTSPPVPATAEQQSQNVPKPPPPPPASPPPVYVSSSSFAFYYQPVAGRKIGFDLMRNMVGVLGPDGKVQSEFPFSGTPLLTPEDLFLLTEGYAYRIDPANGNILARVALSDVARSFSSSTSKGTPVKAPPEVASTPIVSEPKAASPSTPPAPPRMEGDSVKYVLERADGIKKTKGVKAAIDFMTAQRPAAENSASPHLYEFYFRLGEYWEETGDLETALSYYRLATKAIN